MRLSILTLALAVTAFTHAQPSDPALFLNSLYDEQSPVISPDGNTLYFTIGNHPGNIGGEKDPGDIWVSTRAGERWSAPVHAGPLLNNKAYNAVAGVSSNGDQLFLHGHYATSGQPARSQGISISSRSAGGWSRPANITVPYYVNRSALLSGTVSGDGSLFIFSAETYGTYGVEDIYVSFNRSGTWSEPQNLGPAINTQFQELSPSLSHDGKTLYFSSNGIKGRGSFDVFSSVRLDDTWKNWSAPVMMSEQINTSGRELFFRPAAAGTAIFTSTLNSDGYGDIRLYIPEEPFIIADTAVIANADTLAPVAEGLYDSTVQAETPYITVYGSVTNAKTGEPIAATITFVDTASNREVAESTSQGFTLEVEGTAAYNVTVESTGFISTMQKLDINNFEMKRLEMNFSLQPADVGTTVNLENVLFAQAKTDILPESYPELDLVVGFLRANPGISIELSGHTDGRGVHADNVRLSRQRVEKVKEYLVSKGIEGRRISGKGYGGTRPIASNDTEESRRMNRRVEFTIRKSG